MKRSDIYRTIFEFFLNPEVYRNRQHVVAEVFGANLLVRLKRVVESLLGNLYLSITDRPKFDPALKNKKWLVVGTRNQEVSLDFLEDHGFCMVAANFYRTKRPSGRISWYALPKIVYCFRYAGFLASVAVQDFRHFSRVFQELFHGVGVYENQLKALRKYRPEVIVISNDTVPWFRALTLAARELGIPTVYLQHAPVGKDFPPLIVDLALLEGQDALDKYTIGKRSPAGRVEVVGMARYEPFAGMVQESTSVTKVGIAVSLADDLGVVEGVVNDLRAIPELVVTVRQHPRDKRSFSLEYSASLLRSDASHTPALAFLAEQDAIIAGETGIHLEAALLNIPSIYYHFSEKGEPPVDSYGFLAQGLMPAVDAPQALVATLTKWRSKRPEVKSKAAYYVANAEEQFVGSSQEHVLKAIDAFIP